MRGARQATWALGDTAQARERGTARGRQARAAGSGARGVYSRGATGARPGHWARGLGARAGLGLCTRCTRPVFDPI